MRHERVTLTALDLDGRAVRLVSGELEYTRRTLPTDGQSDWTIAGEAYGPLPDGVDAAVVAIGGGRRFSARGIVAGLPVPVRHRFEIRGSDGREIEEA